MARSKDIEERTEKLLGPVAEAAGVIVYDVEYVKEGSDYYLRCFIDKEGGVTIDDCETVSRAMSDILDKEDYIEDAYILEVSSPGLGRALKKDRHLEYSLGESVELKTYKAVDGIKEFEGILKSFDADTITLEIGDDPKKGSESFNFDRKNIAVIRLALDF